MGALFPLLKGIALFSTYADGLDANTKAYILMKQSQKRQQ